MKKFFFLYNNYEREHVNIELISEKIHAKNIKIFQGGIREKDIINKLFKVRPHIIVTFPITTYDQIEIYTMAKILFHSKIITLTTEGVGKFSEEEVAKTFAGFYDFPPTLVDYHIFWGKYMAKYVGEELYKQHKILGKHQIRVFGNPMYENIYHNMHETEFIDSKRIKVLILTGFHISVYSEQDMINAQDIVNIEGKSKQEVLKDNTFNKYKEVVCEEKKYCEKYIQHILDAANRNPDVLFVVKLHPQEILMCKYAPGRLKYLRKLEDVENIKLIKESVPIGSLLPYFQLLVHYGSTVGLEAYIHKVPTLKLELRDVKNNFMVEANRLIESTYYVDVDEDNAISDFVMELKKGKNLFQKNSVIEKQLYAYMNYKDEQNYNPSEQIAEFLTGYLRFHKLDLSIRGKWSWIKHVLKKYVLV